MAKKSNLTKKLEVLGPRLEELLQSLSNPQPQRPPAPACCPRESGKFRGKETAGADTVIFWDEAEVCQTLRHRARVVPYPGLRLEMGRSFHN